MTDTSTREELIKETAKAIQEARWVTERNYDGSVSSKEADSETLARAALAVFEQAHAKELDTSMEPVKKIGDSLQVEREELARWLHVRFGKNQTLDWDLLSDRLKDGWRDIANDAPLAAALRRTAVQGPQGETEWEYGYTSKWGTIAAASQEDAETRAADLVCGITEARESGDLKHHGKVVKRIAASKAGPWMPVEQEGESNA